MGINHTVLATLYKFQIILEQKAFLKTDTRYVLYNIRPYKLPLKDPQVPTYALGILNLLSSIQLH